MNDQEIDKQLIITGAIISIIGIAVLCDIAGYSLNLSVLKNRINPANENQVSAQEIKKESSLKYKAILPEVANYAEYAVVFNSALSELAVIDRVKTEDLPNLFAETNKAGSDKNRLKNLTQKTIAEQQIRIALFWNYLSRLETAAGKTPVITNKKLIAYTNNLIDSGRKLAKALSDMHENINNNVLGKPMDKEKYAASSESVRILTKEFNDVSTEIINYFSSLK